MNIHPIALFFLSEHISLVDLQKEMAGLLDAVICVNSFLVAPP